MSALVSRCSYQKVLLPAKPTVKRKPPKLMMRSPGSLRKLIKGCEEFCPLSGKFWMNWPTSFPRRRLCKGRSSERCWAKPLRRVYRCHRYRESLNKSKKTVWLLRQQKATVEDVTLDRD